MIIGINEHQSALCAISHNVDFLSHINITQSFKLKAQTPQTTNYLPSTLDQYHQQLSPT